MLALFVAAQHSARVRIGGVAAILPIPNAGYRTPATPPRLLYRLLAGPVPVGEMMMKAVGEEIGRAVQLHRAGDHAGAEEIYRSALARDRVNPDVLHLLGVLLHQTGRTAQAIDALRQAIARSDDDPNYHYHLANALVDAGQLADAEQRLRRAIQLDEKFAEAYLNLGALLQRNGRATEAERVYREGLAHRVADAQIYSNLGAILQSDERFAEAAEWYLKAIDVDATMPQAHANLAGVYRRLERDDEAEAHFRRAIELAPEFLVAHHNLGELLDSQDRSGEAEACYLRALEIEPGRYESLVNLGRLYHDVGRLDESVVYNLRAIDCSTERSEAHNNLGKSYQALGRLDEAVRSFDRALEIDPQDADVRMNRALAQIQRQNFRDGWIDHEWRFLVKSLPKRPRPMPVPRWEGGSLAGKRLLIHGEQGIGDEIMFATTWAELAQEAAHCVATCDTRLERLFARSFPQITVRGIARGEEDWQQLCADVDLHIPAGSVPRYTRTSIDDFPRRYQILIADDEKRARWRQRLAEFPAAVNVGISWRAGQRTREASQRSTDLAAWSSLIDVAGARFIDLQYGASEQEVDVLRKSFAGRVEHWDDVDPLGELDDFAALVAELDLVISVGNATVHLAGALGTPTWCLLPRYWGWRWLLGREDSIWYPSVRLLRQTDGSGWGGVFQGVETELRRLTKSSRPDGGRSG